MERYSYFRYGQNSCIASCDLYTFCDFFLSLVWTSLLSYTISLYAPAWSRIGKCFVFSAGADPEKGVHMYKGVWAPFADFILFYLISHENE